MDKEDILDPHDKLFRNDGIRNLISCYTCPRIATEVQNNHITFVVFYIDIIGHFSYCRVDIRVQCGKVLGIYVGHSSIFCGMVCHMTILCQNIFW